VCVCVSVEMSDDVRGFKCQFRHAELPVSLCCAFSNTYTLTTVTMTTITLRNDARSQRTKAYFPCAEKLIKNSKKNQGCIFFQKETLEKKNKRRSQLNLSKCVSLYATTQFIPSAFVSKYRGSVHGLESPIP